MAIQQIDIDPNIVLITQDAARPYAPKIVRVYQLAQYVKVVVIPLPIITAFEVASLRLYRAPGPTGPWSLIDDRPVSDLSVKNNLFDIDPRFGVTSYYAAASYDAINIDSPLSEPVGISPAYVSA